MSISVPAGGLARIFLPVPVPGTHFISIQATSGVNARVAALVEVEASSNRITLENTGTLRLSD